MNPGSRGFTFVEMIGSLAIMALILVLIGGLYTNSVEKQTRTSAIVSTARLGNSITWIIRNDLNSMAFYPGRKTIYFKYDSDTDGMQRRDSISFDATVADIVENGVTVNRFGRITYYAEEDLFSGTGLKKLYRKTVFINDEYIEEDEEKTEDGDSEAEPGEEVSADETESEKEDAVTDVEVNRDEKLYLLTDRLTYFKVDMAGNETEDWKDEIEKGKVPRILKVSFGLAQTKKTDDIDDEGERKEQEFSSVFLPVLAPYASNVYQLASETDENKNEEKKQ